MMHNQELIPPWSPPLLILANHLNESYRHVWAFLYQVWVDRPITLPCHKVWYNISADSKYCRSVIFSEKMWTQISEWRGAITGDTWLACRCTFLMFYLAQKLVQVKQNGLKNLLSAVNHALFTGKTESLLHCMSPFHKRCSYSHIHLAN